MKILAQTTMQTKAPAISIFKLWSDVNNWKDFDDGIEWSRLISDFSIGAHYTLKPKDGPKVKATIIQIDPAKRFVDVSRLPAAKLNFDHSLTTNDGQTIISITISISGPLSIVWAKILGKNMQSDLENSTANLIKKAELSL
jgi:hypothetical protein